MRDTRVAVGLRHPRLPAPERIPFRWVELSGDEHARNEAGVASVGDERLPVCIFPDGTRLDGRPCGR